MSAHASRDWIADVGTLVVGAAAAVLTFTTLRDLATAVGIVGWLAWLVPVTVDVAGVVATRVWLRGQAPADAVAFARALAWSCITGSVAGNAGQHAMAAYDLTAPWPVVVLVSAVPPAMLGAMVHLGHLTRRPKITDDGKGLHSVDTPRGPAAHEVRTKITAGGVGSTDTLTTDEGVHRAHTPDRAASLIASGIGRRRLAVELGIREHEARKMIQAHRVAGVAA